MPLAIPCPQCGKLPPPACDCPPLPPGPPDPPPESAAPETKLRSETIKMRREKRGGGREIIILEGFPKGGFDLDALARDLKRRLGTGGAVKGFTIELQGDHRDALEIALRERGFRSKRAGG
ncbi:MAG TPA: translation initiation factor [Planctomycetota bacterium]|nr:translation initiation factor [Planctomycetota bacterium]